jgi:hypothetical protein
MVLEGEKRRRGEGERIFDMGAKYTI